MLQTRTRALDGTLRPKFEQWYSGIKSKTEDQMAALSPRTFRCSLQMNWRRFGGANRLPEIVRGIAFEDGIKQLQTAA